MKARILFMVYLSVATYGLSAQTHEEKINRELSFEKKSTANAVMIFNINGDVKVEGYDGDKVLIVVEKIIRGKTVARLERGKSEIQLGVLDRADTLILYVEGFCNTFGKLTRDRYHHNKKWAGWGYDWNDCNHNQCKKDYDFTMNFTVKVPATANVCVSTINDGDLEVTQVKGHVLADNINGNILLKNLSGGTDVSAINGDVDLDYVQNPNEKCRYYALNGDIRANFMKGLMAKVAFESFNGDLFTNVDELESIPVAVEKEMTEKGIKYKIGGSQYKVGKGGVLLDFETFNGNVYLKEK